MLKKTTVWHILAAAWAVASLAAPRAVFASAVPQAWNVDVSRVQPCQFNAYHGETIELAASFFSRGEPFLVGGETFALFWQTNGMGSAYWTAPASATSNTVSAVFTAAMDPGAPLVYGFLGSTGSNYRASFAVRFAASPGAAPNELPLPTPIIDFDKVEALNAPYYTKDETDAKIVELSPPADLSNATNYTDSVASSLRESVAVAASSATNYTDNVATTLRGEIAAAQPADYATVSNKAMTALQSYTETDPTIGLTNGTIYVHGSTITPITSHQSLSGYVPTTRKVNNKALSSDINLSASDVGAAPSSLSSTVTTINNKVSALETWSIGNDTQLRVEHAGETNATLAVLYTNRVMYSTVAAESNTLAKAAAYTDQSALELAQAFDAALASDAWGDRTSSGAPSPADTLIVEKPKLSLTGGGNYSYIESSTGGYWVMAVSLGSTWTLQSLADAQNPTNPATVALYDMAGNAVQTVTSTASREAYAVEGEQYIYCDSSGANDVITLVYPIVADSAPTLLFSPVCAGLDAFNTADQWPSSIASVVASGASGMWTNTVTMVGHPGAGFFRAKYTKAGHVYTRFNKPLGLTQVVIGDVTYNVTVETIGGKNLMVLTEAQ